MYVLICNPQSHSFKKKSRDECVKYLEMHGHSCLVQETKARGEAEKIAIEAAGHNGLKAVIVMGGDGTINEVLQGLANQNIPVGILPSGTANVLARSLKIPTDPVGAADIILQNHKKNFSIGKLTLTKENKEFFFLLMAGIGFDAAVCQKVNPLLKKISGKTAYALKSIELCCQTPLQNFDIHTGTNTMLGSWLTVSNCRYYGGEFLLTPEADPFQDCFQSCLFSPQKSSEIPGFFYDLLKNKHSRRKNVHLFKSETVEIHREGIAVQIDGDFVGHTPVRIERIKNALPMIIPT